MGISSGAVQTKKSSYVNECARLVTNAIVYFQLQDTQPAVDQLPEYQGDTKRIDIVKQASLWPGTTLTLKGTYHFELSEKLPDLEELMRSIEGYYPSAKSNTPLEATDGAASRALLSFWTENP